MSIILCCNAPMAHSLTSKLPIGQYDGIIGCLDLILQKSSSRPTDPSHPYIEMQLSNLIKVLGYTPWMHQK